MDINPKFFSYTSPTVSVGTMYEHPIEDIKQSQKWYIDSQSMINQFPAQMQQYLAFDVFDEDKDRYNEIISNYDSDIKNITDDIKKNGITNNNQRNLYDLVSKINTDISTGDLSLMNDKNIAYQTWIVGNSKIGAEEPLLYDAMKKSIKEQLVNTISKEEIPSIISQSMIARPDFNDKDFLNSVAHEYFRRISMSSDGSKTTYSYGNERELAEIINGAMRNADGGYLNSISKYIYDKNIDWVDAIKIEQVEINGKKTEIAVVDSTHPYAKEAQKILDQLRATQTVYKAPKVSNSSYVPYAYLGNTGTETSPSKVQVHTGIAFSLMNGQESSNNDYIPNSKDRLKHHIAKQSLDNYAHMDGCDIDVANSFIDFLYKKNNTTSNPENIKGIDNYFLSGGTNNELKKSFDKYWNDRIYDLRDRINKDWNRIQKYRNNKNSYDNSSIGLQDGVIINEKNNGKFDITDKQSGITLLDCEYEVVAAGAPVAATINCDFNHIKYNGVEFTKQSALDNLNKYAQTYYSLINTYSDKTYKTETLNLSDEGSKKLAKELSKYKNNLVFIDKRTIQDKPKEPDYNDLDETQKKKAKENYNTSKKDIDEKNKNRTSYIQDNYGYYSKEDNKGYKIIGVNSYCGNIDGIDCVFECRVKNEDTDEEEIHLIGVGDRTGQDYWVQNELKNQLYKIYQTESKTIPDNVYRRIFDPYFDMFNDYITTKYVFDFTNKEGTSLDNQQQAGTNYIDIIVDGSEMEKYLGLPFTDKYKWKIRKYIDDTYQLYYFDSKTKDYTLYDNSLQSTQEGRMPEHIIYDIIISTSIDDSLSKNKTFDSVPLQDDPNKSTFGLFLMQKLNCTNTEKINKQHPDYNTDINARIFINAYTFYKEYSTSNYSYASVAYDFQDKTQGKPLYLCKDNNDIKPYFSFTGMNQTNNYKKGTSGYNNLRDGNIITLDNDIEGVVYTQFVGSTTVAAKYVQYTDNAGVRHFIPVDKFLSLGKKCSIGSLTEKGSEKFYNNNNQ